MYKCDIAIIGCGVSGLLTAYELHKRNPDYNIVIFEKSDRVGGRIYTETRDGFIMEYGPMRFEPDLQPRFAELINELDIPCKIFPTYTNPFCYPEYNKLLFEEIEAIEKNKDIAPVFALIKLATKKILGSQWDVDNDDITDKSRDNRKKILKSTAKFNGKFLYEQGLWNVVAQVLSKEAVDFIMQKGTFYHMFHINPNAADHICFNLDVLATIKSHLITIDNGSYTIINTLYNKVKSFANIILEHPLLEYIEDEENKYIKLVFPEKSWYCNRLIITCQKSGLEMIKGFPTSISSLFNSVMIVELFKIFIIVKNPPWKENNTPPPNYKADNLPCREIQYNYDATNDMGMIMIYGDVPSTNYWRCFIQNKKYKPEYDNNEDMKYHLQNYLHKLFPTVQYNEFDIRHYGIIDWYETEYKTGIHLWKPKHKSQDVIKSLASFGINKNIHICGETFSDYQGFIEGCIRTVHGVLTTIPI
jgi:Flavin containing amine oxidoreductase